MRIISVLPMVAVLMLVYAFWWENPALTEMQVFQQTWDALLFGILSSGITYAMIEHFKSKA